MDTLDYIALFMLIFMAALICVLLWFLGGLPGRVAKQRNHPYQDAISVGGWVTLILAGVAWPLVLIWAYAPVRDQSVADPSGANIKKLQEENDSLRAQVDRLKSAKQDEGTKS